METDFWGLGLGLRVCLGIRSVFALRFSSSGGWNVKVGLA